jgi:hypothetical protein
MTEFSYKDDDAFLAAGEGELWHVRVISSHDECNYIDFEVRAETEEEAAEKAETVARRNPERYFDAPSPPTYDADRDNIECLSEEEG